MNKYSIIVATLTIPVAFAITIGSTLMPGWACFLIVAICLIVATVLLSILNRERDKQINKKFDDVDEKITKEHADTISSIKDASSLLLESSNTTKVSIEKEMASGFSSTIETVNMASKTINDHIDHEDTKLTDGFNSLIQRAEIHTDHLQKLISECQRITTLLELSSESIARESDGIKELVSNRIAAVSSAIASFEAASTLLENTLAEQIKSVINDDCTSLNSLIESSAIDIISKTNDVRDSILHSTVELSGTIHTESELISGQVNTGFKSVSEKSDSLAETIAPLGPSIQAAHDSAKNASEQMLQLFGEKSSEMQKSLGDSISKLATKADSIAETVAPLSSSIESVKEVSTSSTEQIKQFVSDRSADTAQKIMEVAQKSEAIQTTINTAIDQFSLKSDSLAETIAPLGPSIQIVHDSAKNASEQMLQLIDGKYSEIDHKMEAVSKQASEMQKSLDDSISRLATKTDSIAETFAPLSSSIESVKEVSTSSTEQIKQFVSDRSADTAQKIMEVAQKSDFLQVALNTTTELIKSAGKEQFDGIQQNMNNVGLLTASIGTKLDSIIENGNKLSEMINEDNHEYDRVAESFINDVRGRFETLTSGIADIKNKTSVIEASVNHLVEQSKNSDAIQSISALISSLSQDIQSVASDINKRILDSQVAQENATKDELTKLQVMLRTLLKSTDVETSTQGSSKSDRENSRRNPNRTESITDSETKNLVINEYKNDLLSKSTLRNRKGKVIYEIDYSEGKIKCTRNYDENGVLTIEQFYYDNGQVHYRNEYRKSGKVSTTFDVDGNII